MMPSKRRTARTARQLFRLCVVSGALDEGRVRRVVAGAIASKRRGVVATLGQFQRLVRLSLERHAALVETVTPLDDAIRAGVVSGIARVHGAGIATSFAQNPALIGGMRVKVGSDVYDGSVRARLDAIESGL
jgi:F-type H+-transporting ATPase subunit delta